MRYIKIEYSKDDKKHTITTSDIENIIKICEDKNISNLFFKLNYDKYKMSFMSNHDKKK
jgi:hypothetical protein